MKTAPRWRTSSQRPSSARWSTSPRRRTCTDSATSPSTAATVARHPNCAGHARLRRVLEELAGDGSDSGFEFMAAQRLSETGLAVDAQQVEVVTSRGRRWIDLAYLRVKVGIECVGFRYHGSRDQFEADATRGNEIAELDEWLILKLTWRMFFGGWADFLATLIRVLRQRGHPVAP